MLAVPCAPPVPADYPKGGRPNQGERERVRSAASAVVRLPVAPWGHYRKELAGGQGDRSMICKVSINEQPPNNGFVTVAHDWATRRSQSWDSTMELMVQTPFARYRDETDNPPVNQIVGGYSAANPQHTEELQCPKN